MYLAKYLWYDRYPFKSADNVVKPFLNQDLSVFNLDKKNRSWICIARNGLFFSQESVGSKLGLSRQAISKWEKQEVIGKLELRQLALAAEAMDCELVYGIRPKINEVFSKTIWNVLMWDFIGQDRDLNGSPNHRGQGLAAILKRRMLSPFYRKMRGWTQRRKIAEAISTKP